MAKMAGLRAIEFNKFKFTQKTSFLETVTDSGIKLLTEIPGNFGPIRADEVCAVNSRIGRQVIHGLMSTFFFVFFGIRLPSLRCFCVVVNINVMHEQMKFKFLNDRY